MTINSPAATRVRAMVVGVAAAAAALVLVATLGFRAYGWTVFVLVPFFVGWPFSLPSAGSVAAARYIATLATASPSTPPADGPTE